jgi:3-methyladenine DNA glycosylase AlkD
MHLIHLLIVFALVGVSHELKHFVSLFGCQEFAHRLIRPDAHIFDGLLNYMAYLSFVKFAENSWNLLNVASHELLSAKLWERLEKTLQKLDQKRRVRFQRL